MSDIVNAIAVTLFFLVMLLVAISLLILAWSMLLDSLEEHERKK